MGERRGVRDVFSAMYALFLRRLRTAREDRLCVPVVTERMRNFYLTHRKSSTSRKLGWSQFFALLSWSIISEV